MELTKKQKETLKRNNAESKFITREAVSYTHLDVYKRQSQALTFPP